MMRASLIYYFEDESQIERARRQIFEDAGMLPFGFAEHFAAD